MITHKWNDFKSHDAASRAAAEFICNRINESIRKTGCCHVILPGGSTPTRCLEYIAEQPLDWSKVHWYLSDERCYPKADEQRNDVMLHEHLWSLISETNIYTIEAELGAEQAADSYRTVIDKIDIFDIAFIGMGEDGHTASLFPENRALEDLRSVVPVYDSPKPPYERVSLGIETLKNTRHRVILTGGVDKREILSRIQAGEALPVNTLGNINWYVYDK